MSRKPPNPIIQKINCPDNDIPLAYTNWFCRHVDPKQRFESEGEDIPVTAVQIYMIFLIITFNIYNHRAIPPW